MAVYAKNSHEKVFMNYQIFLFVELVNIRYGFLIYKDEILYIMDSNVLKIASCSS